MSSRTTRQPWTPRSEVLTGDLDDAIFGADFSAVVEGAGPAVYSDPKAFFQNTHPATSLKKIVELVFDRLANPKEAGAALRLSTGFGGGKTHALIALFHLAHNVGKQTMGNELLSAAGRPKKVAVAAIDVGMAGSPVFARHGAVATHTLWAEIEYQLKNRVSREMAQSDDATKQPDAKIIRDMFPDGPVLILLDEIVKYMSALPEQPQKNLLKFLDTLVSIVNRRPQTVLVTTDPGNQPAYQLDAARATKALAAAKSLGEVLGRKDTNLDPIGEETPKVIARRLFESIDPKAAQKVSAQYLDTYQRVARDHPELIPQEYLSQRFAERMLVCYPFHPRLMETAQNRLGGLENFQKSRGVLRLFAKLIRYVADREPVPALLTAGELNWADAAIQSGLLDRLQVGEFKAAVRADFEKHAGELDESRKDDIHRRVAAALLLESLDRQASSGLDPADLTVAVLRPDEAGPEPTEALDRLATACWFTHQTGSGRWRFQFNPNVNRIVEEKANKVEPLRAHERVESEAQSFFTGGSLFRLAPWPQVARDVRDEPKLQLVLCESEDQAHVILASKDDSDPQAPEPRRFRNAILAVCPSPEALNEATTLMRRLIASEELEREMGAEEMDKQVKEQLRSKIRPELRKRTLIQVCRAFNRVVLPGKRVYQLTEEALAPEGRPVEAARGQPNLLAFLKEKNLIHAEDDSLDPAYLLKHVLSGATPQADAKDVFTVASIHERIMSMPDMKLVIGEKLARSSIIRAVEAGKLVVKTPNRRAYDRNGSVAGLAGSRVQTADRLQLSALSMSDDVFVTSAGSVNATEWLKTDKKDKPVPPPKPTAGPDVYDWPEAEKRASSETLLELTLTAESLADAKAVVSMAQPFGAQSVVLDISVEGELKGGGSVNLAFIRAGLNNPLRPLELGERLLRGANEDARIHVELKLEFGAEGRKGLDGALTQARDTAPQDVKIHARFRTE